MNQQDKQTPDHQQPALEDLVVDNRQAKAMKGGLNYTKIQFDYKPQKPDSSL